MKLIILGFTLILICLVIGINSDYIYQRRQLLSVSYDGIPITCQQYPIYNSDISNELFNLTNEHRVKKGISILERSEKLNTIASHKAYEYSKHNWLFEHNYSDMTWVDIVNDCFRLINYGENLAVGFDNASDMFSGFINSQSHKEIIENEEYTQIGIFTIGDHRNYTAVIFSK